MVTSNKQALITPIMGKVVELNKYIYNVRSIPPKPLQHIYVDTIMQRCSTLYIQAMRELRGKDYLRRAIEAIEEIQSLSYLVYSMKGWNNKVVSNIDAMCDEIAEHLYKNWK